MGNGYPTIQPNELAQFAADLKKVANRVKVLENPTGTQTAEALKQLTQLVDNLATAIANVASSGATWTGPVADPSGGGVTTTGSVSAGGSVTAPGGVSSTGVYNNLLTTAYKVQYINSAGPMGYVPSSRQFKQDIATAPDVKQAALAMRVVTFRYIQAVAELGDDAAIEWGVIAEEIDELGLHWLVDYGEDGKPQGVKYERLVLALVPIVQDHETRLSRAGL